MLKLADRLEALNLAIGRAAAWLTLFMVLLTVVVVVLRHYFDFGRIWMQELVTWSHAVVFLLGAAYTFSHNQHVRVDIFYRRVSPAVRAGIDIAGTLFLLFPFCGLLLYTGTRYAMKSWQLAERSPETGGLAFPFIPAAKTMLLAMVILLIIQGIVVILRNVHALRTREFPGQRGGGKII